MKVAIIGSRDFTSYDTFKSELEKLNLDITSIVSGGAIGTDTLAEQYATEKDITIEIIRPDYKSSPPKVAPLIQNKVIVNKCDLVVAFWNGTSRGTSFVIDYANSHDKKVYIIKI